ncbi:MAG: alginate export family protein [Phycisphaerae bacterium]|nr:alginate export family protein [Phycisphaerae bacterium]MDW8261328.1 alginate export family protein [Phycisphaerales bacterium]
MSLARKLLAGAIGLVASSTTLAQPVDLPTEGAARRAQQDIERFQRQLDEFRAASRIRINQEIPIGTRVFYDYGLFTSFNYLSLDDANLDNRGLRQVDLIGFARINLDGVHELFARGRGFYRDFNDGDAFDPEEGDGWDGHLDRLYYKFDLGRYVSGRTGEIGPSGASIKIGRDLVYWGTGLTLAQDLDAIVLDAFYEPLAVQLVAGRTPSDTVDIDSSRNNFDDHTIRCFYGALASMRVGTHRPYVFALIQRDANTDISAIVIQDGAQPIITRYDYNSYYLGIGSTGALTDRIAYGIEAVYEGGTTLSNSFDTASGAQIPQTEDDIEAYALNVQLDYLMGDRRNTRLSTEFIYASGDEDRISSTNTFAGNAPGTRDEGFNAFGLLNTGTAFSPSVSNLICIRAGASTFPFPDHKFLRRMQVGIELFGFFKADSEGGSDEPTLDRSYLGFEPDLYVNWQITSDISLALRYGVFFPGSAIQADEEHRQFFFAGLTFAF